ncbi:hypothetical protein Xaut_1378 [Xanthobacter versatilis]|uniref:Uncharacterized protein n=1 Tax=Xanthobacter autotrophicus (strain ATCC BAA-1158 / Py2) TaxID=78245 RepID=A7IF33_XANP2|nr:hypothetical protein Xaut_1378 [Xanthobacter autotrophicus Py2]
MDPPADRTGRRILGDRLKIQPDQRSQPSQALDRRHGRAVPAIHVARIGMIFADRPKRFGLDACDKPGHDDGVCGYALLNFQTRSYRLTPRGSGW